MYHGISTSKSGTRELFLGDGMQELLYARASGSPLDYATKEMQRHRSVACSGESVAGEVLIGPGG